MAVRIVWYYVNVCICLVLNECECETLTLKQARSFSFLQIQNSIENSKDDKRNTFEIKHCHTHTTHEMRHACKLAIDANSLLSFCVNSLDGCHPRSLFYFGRQTLFNSTQTIVQFVCIADKFQVNENCLKTLSVVPCLVFRETLELNK